MTAQPATSPFVFVAATRYAIRRTLTGASETIATQVIAHADLIRQDAGATGAILKEIEDARPINLEPQGFGQSEADRRAIVALWDRATEVLSR